jgi:hypothetical protein
VDDLTKPAVGGVAIVEASEQACEEILWRHLDGCPHCDTPNCVVLATITDYHIDRAIDDANINNRTRRLLPSTEILKEYIECLREHGPGGVGQQGPPGDRGNDGLKGDPGLDNVNLRLVDCGQPGSATIVTDNQGKRTLELIIPSGCQTDLTHICGINWTHQRENPRTLFTDRDAGLLIAFDSPVRSRDLHEHSFIVLARRREDRGPICWCEIPGRIEPGDFDVRCDLTSRFVPNQNARVNGVRFVPGVSLDNLEKEFRVILKGDYIRGFKDKGLDADHLPPWFNQANYHSGDGIEGGTFESWFTIEG